jgi:hypothetical protein
LAARNHLLDGLLEIDGLGTQICQDFYDQRVIFGQQPEEEMFGSNVFVVAAMRFVARPYQRFTDPGGEIVACQKSLLVEP